MPRQPPPHLADLLHRLGVNSRLFIEQYDRKKLRMQTIASELGWISKEVKEMQESTNIARMMGAVLGGLGLAVGVAAGFQIGAEKLAFLGGAAAVGGGAAVITANATRAAAEITSLRNVEELGKEFMGIVELQKDVVEKIKEVSEELEDKSSSLMTTTGEQTKRSLEKTGQLQQVLQQTAELSKRSREVMGVTLDMLRGVRELLDFIIMITRITPTSEEDAKFRNCIADSASLCEKTVLEFAKLRNSLKDFEEMQSD